MPISFVDVIETIFGFALLFNALVFVPQAWRIWRSKRTEGVSMITFAGFLAVQLLTVIHGLIHQDWILVVGMVASMVTCLFVVCAYSYVRSRYTDTSS